MHVGVDVCGILKETKPSIILTWTILGDCNGSGIADFLWARIRFFIYVQSLLQAMQRNLGVDVLCNTKRN